MSAVRIVLLSIAVLAAGFLVGLLVGRVGTTLNGVAFLALPALIAGFLVGWVAEWILDNRDRRARESAQREAEIAGANERRAAQHDEAAGLIGALRKLLAEHEHEIHGLRGELQEQAVRYGQLKADFDRYAQVHPDDLTAISGIGAKYQEKLRDAGYSTFEQLAEANAQQLRQALSIRAWQKTDPQRWITQARVLAHKD